MAALETRTLDSIVRETLLEAGLTLHFYLKYLHFMIREMNRFGQQFTFFSKQTELQVNSYNRIAIPAECRGIIDVSIRDGERLQSLFRDEGINKMYYVDSAGKFALEGGDTPLPFPESAELTQSLLHYYDRNGSLVTSTPNTPWYGLSSGEDKAFTVDYNNNELVFTNAFNENDVIVITYETAPVSTSAANTVNYMFVETLKTAAHHNHLKFSGAPDYRIERARQDYINAKRQLKDHLAPFSYADLMELHRKGLHMGIKS